MFKLHRLDIIVDYQCIKHTKIRSVHVKIKIKPSDLVTSGSVLCDKGDISILKLKAMLKSGFILL